MKLSNLSKHLSRILKKLKDTKPDRNKIELAISKTESIGLIEWVVSIKRMKNKVINKRCIQIQQTEMQIKKQIENRCKKEETQPIDGECQMLVQLS